jgi:hypothetical protein
MPGIRWKFILIVLSLGMLAVACTPRPAWVDRMVNKPVCLAPCWNSITPGKTNRDELSQMLKGDPTVFDIAESVGDPWGPVVSWCVGRAPCGQGDISAFSAFDEQGIVQEIYLRPGAALSLKDFVPLYGYPEKVAFADTLSAPGSILVGLLYPSSGLVLEFLAQNLGTAANPGVDLRAELEAGNIIYSVPGLEYYYSRNIVAKKLDQFAWKGYRRYP